MASKNEEKCVEKLTMRLHIDETVLKEMEEDMLTLEDVEAVIEFSERTKRKLIDEEGINIGHKRLGVPTVWVEYKLITDNEYQVVDVYSHRMSIIEPGEEGQ